MFRHFLFSEQREQLGRHLLCCFGRQLIAVFATNDGAPRNRTGRGSFAAIQFAARDSVPAMCRVPIQEGLPGLARLRARDGKFCARLLCERRHPIRVTVRSTRTSRGPFEC